MKGLKVYNVYVEDSTENVYKIPIPAEICKEALREVEGNGLVIGVVPDIDFAIDTVKLTQDLTEKGWKKSEISVLVRLVERARLDKNALPFE